MLRQAVLIIAALALLAPAADANHRHKKHHAGKHYHAQKIRYGGAPGLGVWRKGPLRGRGFAFSSYKGDPFGKNDYYDGDRCFYRDGRDYCDKRRIWTGFNTFNRPRYLHPMAAPKP